MKRRGESKSKRDERVWVSLSPPPSSLAARSTTEHTPSMSNLIPSTLRTRSDSSPTPSSSSSSSDTSDTSPALSLPEHLYTDCQSCRVTGTLTFSAVGLYALTVSRVTAKTPVGKGAASLMGLGAHARPLCLVSSSTQIANTRPNALDRLPRRRSRALDRLLAPAALPLGRSAVVSRPLAPMPTPCCKLRSTQRLEVPHMGLEAAMDSRGPAPRSRRRDEVPRAVSLLRRWRGGAGTPAGRLSGPSGESKDHGPTQPGLAAPPCSSRCPHALRLATLARSFRARSR